MSAIGIFDSGVGGLTVLKAMKSALPSESFVYLGDTARLPYGTKSPRTIQRYLHQNVRFLKAKGVKAIVVACNSASTVLGEASIEGIPVYGVIEPGARHALHVSKNRRIGVLGTKATVDSRAYVAALKALEPEVQAYQKACPLLVPLVEEGWEQDSVTRQVLERYLADLLKENIDTLILGCTHYPVLKDCIQEVVGQGIILVDSAEVVAGLVQEDLHSGTLPIGGGDAGLSIWTTDTGAAFREVGQRILEPFHIGEWFLADL